VRKWVILPLVTALAALAVLALLVWLGVEDARQAALLDARVREAEGRVQQTASRIFRFVQDGGPEEEVVQAFHENIEAWEELQTLRAEQSQRPEPWYARLRQEVRRRTGW
jgi:hypothetical protein